ncbi:MAG: VIT family protein [Rhizobiaceae bacterium]|nr:VIT family protein [Rhizobiaceae bacterium]
MARFSLPRARSHTESHLIQRIGWLRAAILGANDGIVSTASLIVGVAAASSGKSEILVAGLAGLVAGAMSMAAGEYVSVSSQSDTEKADLERERAELAADPDAELQELAGFYIARGVSEPVAMQVARELTERDALGAHAREELGITEALSARPIQAALTSAATFAVGAALPLLVAVLVPLQGILPAVAAASLAFLALLGAIGAKAGGSPPLRACVRVAFWGAAAFAATAAIGAIFGTVAG